jgi:hypothetical protein
MKHKQKRKITYLDERTIDLGIVIEQLLLGSSLCTTVQPTWNFPASAHNLYVV